MKITAIGTRVVNATMRNWVFVKVETDAGITGWGEASLEWKTRGVVGCVDDLAPLIVGQDPRRIEHLYQVMYRHSFFRMGVVGMSALSGIEQALWDILGQALGVPVYELLGGRVRDKIRLYANGPRGETVDEIAQSAEELVGRGFTALKLAPFGATPILAGKRIIDAGVAKVRAVREAVGPEVELMIDAHGRLAPAVAMRAAAALAPFGIMFFEEPCLPTHGPALTRLARKSPIPIAVGERHYSRWAYPELLASRTIGVLQPDIVQSGGLAEARKIAAMAEMHFVAVAPHNPWSWVNTVASLQLDAVTPNFLIQEVIADAEP